MPRLGLFKGLSRIFIYCPIKIPQHLGHDNSHLHPSQASSNAYINTHDERLHGIQPIIFKSGVI